MMIAGSQIYSDRRLLNFNNYDEYLDSLVTPLDLGYLGGSGIARRIAEHGYRSTGETIDKETFNRRLRAVKDLIFPIKRPYVLDSELLEPRDTLRRELSLRERSNRLGVLSTIIYIRQFTEFNHEISGYIDFADRLTMEDWLPFFRGKKRIGPQRKDIAYYNWRIGKSYLNVTANYRPIVDRNRGLSFVNLRDRTSIVADPSSSSSSSPPPGIGTTRTRVYGNHDEHVVLYDHVVRVR